MVRKATLIALVLLASPSCHRSLADTDDDAQTALSQSRANLERVNDLESRIEQLENTVKTQRSEIDALKADMANATINHAELIKKHNALVDDLVAALKRINAIEQRLNM